MKKEEEDSDSDTDHYQVPSFVEESMTQNELLNHFKDIIRSNFNPLSITVYLNGTGVSEFLQIAMIMNGMLAHKREDLFLELVGLWGYYLTLQISPDTEARNDFLELIRRNRYPDIIDGMVSVCQSLKILSPFTKKCIIKGISAYPEFSIKLKISNLKYLYNLTAEFIDEKLTGFSYDLKVEALVFEDVVSR